ncbi:MAG: HAD-IA family hydrolase [Oscillospiraceae bacterium]|nr:HAD-IA family hydrolase [Oscillospiraceae bacterium]
MGTLKYETVLFDFDGTLLYTIPDLADAVNYALEKYGYPTHDYPTVQTFVGNGVRILVARALPGGEENPDMEKVFAAFGEYYDAHCVDKTVPYEGIMELLKTLSERGKKLAIVTNKYQEAAEELRKRFFDEYISVIVGDIPDRERKPAAAPVRAALEALGVSGNNAVYIGDTEVDMQTAENSGLDFIACAWGYRTKEFLEDLGVTIADTPVDILKLV